MAEKKRPKKGILKNSSSFDTQDQNSKKHKETKWDEMNIIATLHPPDKDYGHMKIEEPKTPYNYMDPDQLDIVDAKKLAEHLKQKVDSLPKVLSKKLSESDCSDDDDDADLTPEERERRKEFKKKRKQHYNEFYAVKLARKLLEEEDEDEDGEEKPSASKSPGSSSSSSPSRSTPSPGKSPDRSRSTNDAESSKKEKNK